MQQIVRRGKHGSVRARRAMIIMAAASGTAVPAIARLVVADEDTVRDVIHAFNAKGLNVLDPRWAGGRPRLISDEDIAFVVQAATIRPKTLGLPFTRWSLRKLAAYLSGAYRHTEPGRSGWIQPARKVTIGRERLRQVLHANNITFQRTRTWKQSTDPEFDAKLDRIEHVTTHFPDRVFAFDQFGPLSIRPHHGSTWAPTTKVDRLPATYRRTPGIGYFHGCYSLGEDQLWGTVRRRKGGDHTLTALKSIRAARPDGALLYVIMDNLSANTTPDQEVGGRAPCRALPDPDLLFVGQPDRGPLQALTDVHQDELELSQPHRPHPRPAGPPALAQRPRPPPRHPGGPAARTRPHPQRERTPLGPTQEQDHPAGGLNR